MPIVNTGRDILNSFLEEVEAEIKENKKGSNNAEKLGKYMKSKKIDDAEEVSEEDTKPEEKKKMAKTTGAKYKPTNDDADERGEGGRLYGGFGGEDKFGKETD